MSYKEKHDFDTRKSESTRILSKYPDKIPIICEKSGRNVPDLDKYKFLVPDDITMGQFMFILRKRLELSPEKAIYLFAGNSIMSSSKLMSQIYDEFKDEDGFLYFKYSSESTFG